MVPYKASATNKESYNNQDQRSTIHGIHRAIQIYMPRYKKTNNVISRYHGIQKPLVNRIA